MVGTCSSFVRLGGSSSSASSCSAIASDASFSSSSYDINQTQRYHVFLSFRGLDTRKKFTSHLHHALRAKGVETYMDNRLDSGDQISPAILKAIESSKIAVIVFSENYASSPWCLDELLHIVNCNLIVIPIFYGVHPSHVRRHKVAFGTAIEELQQRFKPKKLNAWREALEKVANISGYHSDSDKYETEAELVEEIVYDISEKLDATSIGDNFHLLDLVGMNGHVAHVQSLLAIGSQHVHIIGIWGIGGIGKTTLAKTLYDRLKSQFEGNCFLPNIRETLKKQGEEYLQKKLFSDLLREENPKMVEKRLRSKKALIVLDDMDNDHIQPELFGTLKHGWFGPGSRIIVTTRNKQVLQNIGVDNVYEVPLLDLDKGCELFQLKAFRSNTPPAEYLKLIESFVSYAGGLPLALKVLASSLYDRSIKEWKSALVKLQKFPNCNIDAVLRLSFDGLDQQEKDIFLDIACFFKGKPINVVTRILEAIHSCGAGIGISVLKDKSLIYVDQWDEVQMHDLVQQMGWNITYQECIEEPGKRKRIFTADDVIHILEENTGTPSICGIVLDTCHIKDIVHLNATCFSNMPNLKLLMIYDSSFKPYLSKKFENKLNLPEGLDSLPRGLRYLEWQGYSCKYLPSKLCLRNLVELIMPHSLLQRLWEGALPLDMLETIDLRHSTHLVELPNISEAPKLVDINLQECGILFSISFAMEDTDMGSNIQRLNLSGCTPIETIPLLIVCFGGHLLSYMHDCKRLMSSKTNTCTLISQGLEILRECCSKIKFLLDNYCSELVILSGYCSKIKILVDSFRSDLAIFFDYCSELENSREIMEHVEDLRFHDLVLTSMKKLLQQCIYGLQELIPHKCGKIQCLPTVLPVSLQYLYVSRCKSLKSLLELPQSLRRFHADSCTLLKKISISRIRLTDTCSLESELDYSFENCSKIEQSDLDKIISVAQPPILFPSENYTLSQETSNKWSGNENPECTGYKSSGSSIRIELPLKWLTSNFLGFSICLVVEPVDAQLFFDSTTTLFIHCMAIFKIHHIDDCVKIGFSNSLILEQDVASSTDLTAVIHMSPHGLCDEPNEVTFYLFACNLSFLKDVNIKIKKGGFNLLYGDHVAVLGVKRQCDGVEEYEKPNLKSFQTH